VGFGHLFVVAVRNLAFVASLGYDFALTRKGPCNSFETPDGVETGCTKTLRTCWNRVVRVARGTSCSFEAGFEEVGLGFASDFGSDLDSCLVPYFGSDSDSYSDPYSDLEFDPYSAFAPCSAETVAVHNSARTLAENFLAVEIADFASELAVPN